MNNLPGTLEEMQRDILQGDLSNNPYLQGSSIPFKDKELKTKSKKVIPAINELLNMVNTFSEGIKSFMNKTQTVVDELKLEVENMKKTCDCQTNIKAEGEEVMALKSKVNLKRGESKTIISLEELYDPERQIKIYAYEESSKKYKFINYTFKQQTNGNSVHQFDIMPIELQIGEESSDVLLINRSSWDLIVLVFE